jgi:hypothetical protein
MENILFKKETNEASRERLVAEKPLFVMFRYAPHHKEGFKKCKQDKGLRIKCKFVTGL